MPRIVSPDASDVPEQTHVPDQLIVFRPVDEILGTDSREEAVIHVPLLKSHFKVQSLTYLEIVRAKERNVVRSEVLDPTGKKILIDKLDMTRYHRELLQKGVVQPKLNEDAAKSLIQNHNAKAVWPLVQKILELSGELETEEDDKKTEEQFPNES